MKKILLTLLLVAALFSYAAFAQLKGDALARQEEAIQKQNEALAMQQKALDVQKNQVMKMQSLVVEQAEKKGAIRESPRAAAHYGCFKTGNDKGRSHRGE